MAIKKGVNHSNNKLKKDVLQEIWMTFYESIAIKVRRLFEVVRMFIETSGECAIHFDWEAKCVTDAG